MVVGEAGDGQEGLTLIEAQRPDAVLLDLSMPGLNGLDAIPEIKKCSDAKVVVVSAAGRSLQADALEMGADGYFSKSEPLEHIVFSLGKLFPSH